MRSQFSSCLTGRPSVPLPIRFALLVLLWGIATMTTDAWSQTPDRQAELESRISRHLRAGEFSLAQSLTKKLPPDVADRWMGQIAKTQRSIGATTGAFDSASRILDDRQRASTLAALSYGGTGGTPSLPVGPVGGSQGGITQQSFQPLIDLITGTIATESWIDSGTGQGTIQAYPAGVYVDHEGTLRRIKIDSQSKRLGVRHKMLWDSGNRVVHLPSQLRKISLTRLERQAQLLAAQGKPIGPIMQNLAGMTEIRYLMVFPETGDIVIAGPAGPWEQDATGRSVSVADGRPVLQLDDLVVLLRNARNEHGRFGCSITPRQQNLANTKKFLATSHLHGKKWAQQLQEILGKQDIDVFGIPRGTHVARILIEADLRMKRIGMGLEPSVPGVPSFLERIELLPDGSVPPMDVVRWWFTLDYENVFADPARSSFTFTGQGVKVLSENELLNDAGERIHTGKTAGPAKAFAHDFTQHFKELSAEYPIYGELKNVFDLALVANLICDQKLDQKANWHLTFWGDEGGRGDGASQETLVSYPMRLDRPATQVDSIMNYRIIKVRKRSSTLRHTIVGISGGVIFQASEAIDAKNLKPMQGADLKKRNALLDQNEDRIAWWWD